MKASEFKKLIREEVRRVLKEDVALKATSDSDLQLIIDYLRSIGIKPVFPRFFTNTFEDTRDLEVSFDYKKRPSKEYEALQTNQAKFREVLQKANVPNTPVLVYIVQDNFGGYMLGMLNRNIKQVLDRFSKDEGFQSFIIK
jgi:hypothetical protein